MAKTAKTNEPIQFEDSLGQLTQLVEKLESGELSLDESIAVFEKGVHLTKQCQTALTTAEQRVEVLMKKTDGPKNHHQSVDKTSQLEINLSDDTSKA